MKFRFLYQIDRRTNKEGTKDFMEQGVMRCSPVACSEVAVILDNHSANHSHLVTGYCRDNDLELKFLPPYSSVLNPGMYPFYANFALLVERVWALLKKLWGKKLAAISHDATPEQVDEALV